MWNFIIVEGPKLQCMHPFLEELERVELLKHFSNTLCISPLFAQLMHTNYYKIFNFIVAAYMQPQYR